MALIITITIINNHIIVIITIILIKNSNNNIFKQQKKKRFLAYCPKVTLVGTGFELATFELSSYLSKYLTRPNDPGYFDYLCMPVFFLAYNRRFDYKLFLTLFYGT